jgi:23S rRNA pseudouridine1911/1915/1917 synthase
MQEYGTKKEYCAYLCGTLPNGSGTVDAPIGRVADGQMLRAVMPEGQRAVTRYETTRLGEIFEETVSETRFFLETGRTHQIRVHSSYLGAPILGDRLYGTEKSIALSEKLGVTEQLLHAGVLTFLDPLSGKEITISAPVVRDDMLKVAGVL